MRQGLNMFRPRNFAEFTRFWTSSVSCSQGFCMTPPEPPAAPEADDVVGVDVAVELELDEPPPPPPASLFLTTSDDEAFALLAEDVEVVEVVPDEENEASL